MNCSEDEYQMRVRFLENGRIDIGLHKAAMCCKLTKAEKFAQDYNEENPETDQFGNEI